MTWTDGNARTMASVDPSVDALSTIQMSARTVWATNEPTLSTASGPPFQLSVTIATSAIDARLDEQPRVHRGLQPSGAVKGRERFANGDRQQQMRKDRIAARPLDTWKEFLEQGLQTIAREELDVIGGQEVIRRQARVHQFFDIGAVRHGHEHVAPNHPPYFGQDRSNRRIVDVLEHL